MLAASLAIALAWWGPLPCQPVVKVADLSAIEAVGQYTRTGPDTCLVEIHSQEWTFNRLCYAVVHEVGHAAGLGHSADRRSVMFPRLPPRGRTAAACRGRRPAQYPAGTRIRL
jgi:hypothetical protein